MRESEGTGRRRFLQWAAGATVAALAFPAAASRRLLKPRALSLTNLHTGESFSGPYWADGRYIPDSMRRLNRLLRDFRNDEIHPMDPRLIDLVSQLQNRMGHVPFFVVSGYRSAQTNALLASMSDGVAQNSFHMSGRALDISVPDHRLRHLRNAALSLKAGGVGYYRRSNFVHLDTGPVRHW